MTSKHRILGLDPGLSGGWALIDETGNLLRCGDFPTYPIIKNGKKTTQIDRPALANLLGALNPNLAFIESVSSRPRQAGAFQFGFNTGLLYGTLCAQGVAIIAVSPSVWKPFYGLQRQENQTQRDTKNAARAVAAELYPGSARQFARVKDDGVAEAALIALYGLNKKAEFRA